MNDDEKSTLIRIEGKIDQLMETRKDHELRIRSMEQKLWIFGGAISVLVVVWDTVKIKLFN